MIDVHNALWHEHDFAFCKRFIVEFYILVLTTEKERRRFRSREGATNDYKVASLRFFATSRKNQKSNFTVNTLVRLSFGRGRFGG